MMTKPMGELKNPSGDRKKSLGESRNPSGFAGKSQGDVIFPEAIRTKPKGKIHFPEGNESKPKGKTIFPLRKTAFPKGNGAKPEGKTDFPLRKIIFPEGNGTKPKEKIDKQRPFLTKQAAKSSKYSENMTFLTDYVAIRLYYRPFFLSFEENGRAKAAKCEKSFAAYLCIRPLRHHQKL